MRKCMMSHAIAVALCGIGLAAGVGNGHKTGAVQTGTTSWSTGVMTAVGGETTVCIVLKPDGIVPDGSIKVAKNGAGISSDEFSVHHDAAADKVTVSLLTPLAPQDTIRVIGASTNDRAKVKSAMLE